MPDGPMLDAPRLSPQEMQQLQVLLFRYLANKPAGFADVVTDKLVHKCQMTTAADAAVPELPCDRAPDAAEAEPAEEDA